MGSVNTLLYLGRVHLSFRGVGSTSSLLFFFCWKDRLVNTVNSDQAPQYVTGFKIRVD